MATFKLSAFADEAGATLDEQIIALKENGIKFIEPRFVNGKGILDLTDAELSQMAKALAENGIKVNALGSPIGKYDIDAPFEEHLEKFKRALEVAKALGTDKIRMFSFFVGQDSLVEKRDEVIRRLSVMVEMAKAEGILLCHENESLIYGQMPEEVKDLLTTVDGLYGIFDPANYRMNNADVIEGINATLINLAYLHIKDAEYKTQTILPAGEGEGRIGEVIDIVNDKSNEVVYLTLEPHLNAFEAYKTIDTHELRNTRVFATTRESFDFATNALKALLTKHGYKETEVGTWKK
ncbi:MAG: sugar phosphate isomerase/epimerase [Clostridia bacterium]|nr:sugar phosphate isomerase/epimerase [Clostridia bacterium]